MSGSPKFSIITPTWNRMEGGKLPRALASVETQFFGDFEHILVDDGSTDGTGDWWRETYWNSDDRFYLIQIKHQGRVIARNTGMRSAQGEWICWLDSDDALDPMYLATLDFYSKQEPDAMIWVVGAIVHGVQKDKDGRHLVPKWTKFRKPWIPPVDSDGKHVIFNSGKVGTGMFAFRRECLNETGFMPDWLNHNQIANGMNDWLGLRKGDEWYDHWGDHVRLVGNPFGDDHAMFVALCQHFRAHACGNACLYTHYVR